HCAAPGRGRAHLRRTADRGATLALRGDWYLRFYRPLRPVGQPAELAAILGRALRRDVGGRAPARDGPAAAARRSPPGGPAHRLDAHGQLRRGLRRPARWWLALGQPGPARASLRADPPRLPEPGDP